MDFHEEIIAIVKKKKLSEKEMDKIVVMQAEDDSAWEQPIPVRKKKQISLSVAADLAARAAFLAFLHRQANVEGWLTRIIRDRIELEEAAFAALKRDFAAKTRAS